MSLTSISVQATGLKPLDFLRWGLGRPRSYWRNPHTGITLAGVGNAANISVWGANRFEQVEKRARDLWSSAHILSPNKLARPRLFGGFSFREDFTPDNTWSIFPPAQFRLAHWQLATDGTETWLTVNAIDAETADLEEAAQTFLDNFVPPNSTQTVSPNEIIYPLSETAWSTMITLATDAIKAGAMEKVVLSRVCEIGFDGISPVDHALESLHESYPRCTQFLFEPEPNHAFFGATPELLVAAHDTKFETMGLAGSIQRGQHAAEDAIFAQELLDSEKNRQEHQLVVDSIEKRIKPLADALSIPAEPSVWALGNIQHLLTPISATLKSAMGVLPLVKLLHPTPALGGKPREKAMGFIKSAEPVPRGWYAAPIGVIDPDLDGTFAVGIRSAVSDNRRVWLHAGAGIMADSDPSAEWDETDLKFRPLRSALVNNSAI